MDESLQAMGQVIASHRVGYGETPGGRMFARCSCGWRCPARAKLTHVISDLRDHSAEMKAAAKLSGVRVRLDGLSVVLIGDVKQSDDTPAEVVESVAATG